jgi:hypothetical protein
MTHIHTAVDATFAALREVAEDQVHIGYLRERLSGLKNRLARIEAGIECLADNDVAYLRACYRQVRQQMENSNTGP